MQECAQILGLSSTQVVGLLNDSKPDEESARLSVKRPVNQ